MKRFFGLRPQNDTSVILSVAKDPMTRYVLRPQNDTSVILSVAKDPMTRTDMVTT